jgi:hypothetical protein
VSLLFIFIEFILVSAELTVVVVSVVVEEFELPLQAEKIRAPEIITPILSFFINILFKINDISLLNKVCSMLDLT